MCLFYSVTHVRLPTLFTFNLLMSEEGLKGKGTVGKKGYDWFPWLLCLLEHHCLLSESQASSYCKGNIASPSYQCSCLLSCRCKMLILYLL